MKTVVLTVAVLAVLAGLVGLAGIYSGVISVAADYQDHPLVAWFLSATSDHSIARRARDRPTIDLTAPESVLTGAGHYKEMCVICHGYPGGERSEVSQGLNPEPPDLKEAGAEWPDAHIYWVIKHGIRMTGMPAFGKTHDENELWAMVAFVRQYPKLSPQAYQELAKKAPAEEESPEEGHPGAQHNHSH